MRHIRTTAAVTLTAALFLAGCGTSTDDAKAAATSATPSVSKQDRFLNAVHDANIASWTTEGPTDAELADYPKEWCAGLADGHSVAYLFDMSGSNLYPMGDAWGTKKADAYKVLVMGVTAYCPDYRSDVVKELQATGEY